MSLSTFQSFNESKNIGALYHIIDFDKLKYIIENNHLKSYKAGNSGGISTTRNKMMNGYLGDNSTSFFKLELDGGKISHKYKIKPMAYISRTNVRFEEYEELIITKYKPLTDLDKYVNKLIISKDRIERLRKTFRSSDSPSDFFTTAGTRSGTVKEMMKWVVDNSPYDIWVQSGSKITKDDAYIDSLVSYELFEVEFKYDVWYRGYVKHPSRLYGSIDTLTNDIGETFQHWAVGDVYDTKAKLKDKSELDMTLQNKKIDGVKFKPYFVEFRILPDGSYYLVDVRPLEWMRD